MHFNIGFWPCMLLPPPLSRILWFRTLVLCTHFPVLLASSQWPLACPFLPSLFLRLPSAFLQMNKKSGLTQVHVRWIAESPRRNLTLMGQKLRKPTEIYVQSYPASRIKQSIFFTYVAFVLGHNSNCLSFYSVLFLSGQILRRTWHLRVLIRLIINATFLFVW